MTINVAINKQIHLQGSDGSQNDVPSHQNESIIKTIKFGTKFEKRIYDNLVSNPTLPNAYEMRYKKRHDVSLGILYDLARIGRALFRFLVFYCGKICRINPENSDYKHKDHLFKKEPFLRRLKNQFVSLLDFRNYSWADLIMVYYYYSCSRIMLNLFYQYKLDGNTSKLKRFRRLKKDPDWESYLMDTMNETFYTFEDTAQRRIEMARIQLDEIGCPHREWAVIVECYYVYILELSFVEYFLPAIIARLYNLTIRRFDVVNCFIDMKAQLFNEIRNIRIEVNEMVESSRSFTDARIQRIMMLTGTDKSNIKNDSNLRSLLNKHHNFVKHLKQVAIEGKLQPLNRSIGAFVKGDSLSDRTLRRFSMYYFVQVLAGLLYFGFLIEHQTSFLPQHYKLAEAKMDTWLDMAFMVDLGLLTVLVAIATFLHCSLVALVATDQSLAMQNLNKLVNHCIISNETSHFKLLLDSYLIEQARRQQVALEKALADRPSICNGLSSSSSSSSLSSPPPGPIMDQNRPLAQYHSVKRMSSASRRRASRRLTVISKTKTSLNGATQDENNDDHLVAPQTVASSGSPDRWTTQQANKRFSCFWDDLNCMAEERAALEDNDDNSLQRHFSNSKGCMPLLATCSPLDDEERYELFRNLEEDLILSLMHYRLFVGKLNRSKKFFGLFTASILFLALSYPLIIRLHVKYFDKSLKPYAFWVSAMCSCPILLLVAPICYLNSRCLDIYSLLWSLLARLIAIETSRASKYLRTSAGDRPSSGSLDQLQQQQLQPLQQDQNDASGLETPVVNKSLARQEVEFSDGGGGRSSISASSNGQNDLARRRINLEYTISLLRKELLHPDGFSNQFTARSFGFKVTFTNMLKVMFWLWILVISILTESNTDKQGLFTHLLKDPLGFHTFN